MNKEFQSMYHLYGERNYWVITRAGYDVDAFTNEKDAKNRLANLQDLELQEYKKKNA